MRKITAVTLVLMMCTLSVTAGCGKSDSKSEEATEATSEIAITSDVAETVTEETVSEEPVEAEIEEYDFSVTEEVPVDTVSEDAATASDVQASTDEFGITGIDEIKLYAKESVRMRTEPNTDSEIAGQLKAGDEVTANGKNEEWHRIKKANGDVVYVKSEYLTETKTEKKEENTAETTETETKKTTTETTTTTTETAATDTAATDAAAQALAAVAAAQAAANTNADANAQTEQKSTDANAQTEQKTETAQTTTETTTTTTTTVPAAAGTPSWAVGLHGVSAAGAADAYNYLKNTKGLDDGTIQGNWDSLMFHYSEHGTAGW